MQVPDFKLNTYLSCTFLITWIDTLIQHNAYDNSVSLLLKYIYKKLNKECFINSNYNIFLKNVWNYVLICLCVKQYSICVNFPFSWRINVHKVNCILISFFYIAELVSDRGGRSIYGMIFGDGRMLLITGYHQCLSHLYCHISSQKYSQLNNCTLFMFTVIRSNLKIENSCLKWISIAIFPNFK